MLTLLRNYDKIICNENYSDRFLKWTMIQTYSRVFQQMNWMGYIFIINHTDLKKQTYLQSFYISCLNLNLFLSLTKRNYAANVPLDPPHPFGGLGVLAGNKIRIVPKWHRSDKSITVIHGTLKQFNCCISSGVDRLC